jgi:murein DD-endopeptidase MepM/ murein hydrolase activator NlpD
MLGRIGVLALAGLLGLFGAMLLAHTSPAAPGPSDTSTTIATSTVVTTNVTSTAVSTKTAATPPPPPVGVPLTRGLAGRCVTAGGVMLLVPHRAPVVLKPVADSRRPSSAGGAFVYPAGGAVVRAAGVAVRAGRCGGDARARVTSPSLFGRAVTASAATLTLRDGRAQAVVDRLEIRGRAIAVAPGARARVASWGYVTRGERRALGTRTTLEAALAVHLRKAHAGLPAGTTVVAAFAVTASTGAPRRVARPRQSAVRKKRGTTRRALSRRDRGRRLLARLQRAHRPLKLTPPLGLPHYVFPVAGPASYGDSYGAARSDVSWHHGDDIFAPLGTPVVAVADGTLNRVGWERLGGWRLWVRDDLGNEFYYAHLSGYTEAAIRGQRVKAGQVLGFVGDTGDAYGTPFHLHFEIHPRSLLPLRYDGAVDPTTYLERWHRLSHARGSRPLHPALPRGTARAQAIYVFRELLAERGLIRRRPARPRIAKPARGGDFSPAPAVHRTISRERPRGRQEATRAPTQASTLTLEGIAALFLAVPAALAATLFRRRN